LKIKKLKNIGIIKEVMGKKQAKPVKKSNNNKKSKNKLSEIIYEEKNNLDDINYNLNLLKERLLEKTPSHFSMQNIISAFFGALLIGLTFVLKGALVRTAIQLNNIHIISIIIFTFLIIFTQIYFISYQRVKNKGERLFGQFVVKRFIAILLIALSVSTLLVFLLGINFQVSSNTEVFKIIILLWMACSIGSGIPGLLIKY
jgi:uncharacterized membrane protein